MQPPSHDRQQRAPTVEMYSINLGRKEKSSRSFVLASRLTPTASCIPRLKRSVWAATRYRVKNRLSDNFNPQGSPPERHCLLVLPVTKKGPGGSFSLGNPTSSPYNPDALRLSQSSRVRSLASYPRSSHDKAEFPIQALLDKTAFSCYKASGYYALGSGFAAGKEID